MQVQNEFCCNCIHIFSVHNEFRCNLYSRFTRTLMWSSSVAHYGKFPTLRVVYLIWQVGCRQLQLICARAACIIHVILAHLIISLNTLVMAHAIDLLLLTSLVCSLSVPVRQNTCKSSTAQCWWWLYTIIMNTVRVPPTSGHKHAST